MSQLKEALRRKIEKQKEWQGLSEGAKKDMVERMAKQVKEGRRQVKQTVKLYQ